ncbi:MAG: sugar ABC transporter ATP-binding protein [Acidimicrobiia bacterium]
MVNISKAFPGVQALREVSMTVEPGEVHALVGENGAGKSTLIQIISGAQQADSGDRFVDGTQLNVVDERTAFDLGIGTVYQEPSLFVHLTVAENVFADRHPTRGPAIQWRRLFAETKVLLDRLGVDVSPRAQVRTLSPAQRQLVEIAKALSSKPNLVILDEPTSALTIRETEILFGIVRKLRDAGGSVIYISHRLAEVFRIADRVTVLKDGAVVGERRTSETTEAELIRLMVGRDLLSEPTRPWKGSDEDVVLRVENARSGTAINHADLTVHAGEIVCLAGLVGAGRTQLCELIFGARPLDGGTITLGGVAAQFRHPSDAMARGVAMVPEDRKNDGLFLEMDVRANVVAANLEAVSKNGVLWGNRTREYTLEQVQRLRVVPPLLDRPVKQFSGGNQQKILLGRWLGRGPRLLVVDEPTRGVDVGARAEIYGIIRSLADTGTAVLVVSSDLPEVLNLANRIVVMSEGSTVGELDARTATEEAILTMASPKGNGNRAA